MVVNLLIINIRGTRGIGYTEQKLCRPLIFEQQRCGDGARGEANGDFTSIYRKQNELRARELRSTLRRIK